jgi:H+-translocating diphosphatase
LLWALIQFSFISKIPVQSGGGSGEEEGLISSGDDEAVSARLKESFLKAEYTVCFWFVIAFAILILVLVSWGTGWDMARGSMTAISFLLGAFTSMASGYLGMKVAVFSNVRTTVSAQKPGWTECFNTAFRAGAVMGEFQQSGWMARIV